MLHELLLALNGYPGSIFVKGENEAIQVLGEIPYLHPTEVALLNRLCKLATHYTRFVSFIRKHGPTPGGGKRSGLHGLYLRAFCQGLDAVLGPYRLTILDIERHLLADPHLTASYVQSQLEEYQLLFPTLAGVLDQIQGQRAHGCHILEILHKAAACGIPIAKEAIFKILHECHAVLFKQLSAWMLHGILLDSYDEFFIHRVQTVAPPVSQEVEEDELGLGGVTGRQIRQMMQVYDPPSDQTSRERFALRAEMLPSYIPARLADKILFVGESVQMFETEKTGAKVKHRGSILRNQEDHFAKELHGLSKHAEFDLMAFDLVIDRIRGFAAEQLWRLVVEEADLAGQLRTLKDFYLLGRGELFLAFIDQAQPLLRSPPTATIQHDVNMGFQHAAHNVLLEDEGLLQRFNFTIDPKYIPQQHGKRSHSSVSSEQGDQVLVSNGWSVLDMTYSVEWPLHVLLTPGVLDRYNTIFKFLLYVKRIQLELQQCWALQMHHKHHRNQASSTTKWWLRNHMAFLVDNLQYYLQVDVIESQFSILLDKIQSTRDFETIRLAHDNFLTSLLSQSFILMKPIAHCLGELLELCHRFCSLMLDPERGNQGIEAITTNFQRQSNLLFKILSSVRSHQSSPHLAQLLLRIDFNKYFTMAGGQLGSRVLLPPETLSY